MILNPYQVSDDQKDAVWKAKKWEMPTGFCQIFRFPAEWEPYEKIGIITDEYHVFLSTDDWRVVNLGEDGKEEIIVIEPPTVAVFARGHGESPAEVISSARDTVESVSGLINLQVGRGFPILVLAYEGVYRKDRAETIKYFAARTRIVMTGVTRLGLVDALQPLSDNTLNGLPEHLKLAYRWYGKGISDDHPVDKFIALYECCLAVVTRWHYAEHPQEYKGRNAPPRKQFGDWVRKVLEPTDQDEEDKLFEPFNEIVETRNRIFKANVLIATTHDIENVVVCATRLLNWSLSGNNPAPGED